MQTLFMNMYKALIIHIILYSAFMTSIFIPLDELCTFESSSLCGWTIDNSTALTFQLHTGRDTETILRTRGPRFDHTYRSAKDIGETRLIDK